MMTQDELKELHGLFPVMVYQWPQSYQARKAFTDEQIEKIDKTMLKLIRFYRENKKDAD